ncbi:MAG: hypothetical protein M0D55_07635 [Elusimicrobiota bacterium]|nr:MAG: hypothetical protein M0D55_07635 [Elusimicrobiota bacterium]
MNTNLLVALMLIAGNAAALDADDDAAESQWTVPEAAPPAPGAPSGTPEGGYADPDRRRMDEERRKDVLDQLCRKLKLNKDFSVGGDNWPKTTIGFTRRMEADIDGGLAMIDEERLSVGWNKALSEELGGSGASGSVYAGATVAGKSMVIRRMGTFNTCGEVDRLLNVTDIKLAIPFTSKRIMAMEPGELWRIPLTLNVGYGASASDALDGSGVTMSFGMGKSKNGAASMTLWRLDQKRARFRFRIDYVDVRSRHFNVSKTIPAAEFAMNGTNAALGFLEKQVQRQLNKYTALYLSLGRSKSNGRRLVLEYVIDPTDPEQARAMAEALQGNFRDLLTLARKMATSKTSADETRDAYADLQEENALRLGYASYAAMSQYHGRSRTTSINIPFLFKGDWSSSRGSDTVVRYTGEGGEFTFHNAARSPNGEYFNVPFLGPIVKDIESRNVEFVTYAPNGQEHQAPFGVYMHNQAFLRMPASTVTGGLRDANEILSLAGAARTGGRDRTMGIPLPQVPPVPEDGVEANDQKGWTSLTMVISPKAVADAATASAQELLKAWAFATKAEDRTMAEWLVANGRLENGRMVYDQAQAARDLGWDAQQSHQSWLQNMAGRAAGLVGDMAEAAGAASATERSAALARAFSHENRSGMGHADVFRVLIQFIDPLDVTGDFVAAVDSAGRRGTKIQAHYVLKKGRAEVAGLSDAGATRGRFADGSIMTD